MFEKFTKLFEKDNRFKTILILVLFLLFIIINLGENKNVTIRGNEIVDNSTHIFTQKTCRHCYELEKFFKEQNIAEKYDVVFHELEKKENFDLLLKYIYKYSLSMSGIGTPAIFTRTNYLIGFEDTDAGKERLINFLDKSTEDTKNTKANIYRESLKVPFIGEVKLFDLSLPVLTVLVGLADGFNPCAMWVLVYLLSITVTLGDRKKIWFLVGSFVLSSGILYYLFMTAWLNVFLLVGYIRLLNLIIGLFALYFGTMMIYKFIKNNGEVVCELEDNKIRNNSMNKIKNIVNQKLSPLAIMSVVLLAFAVNSLEFVCSAALPATYTYILSQLNLSTFTYYMYILLYTVMYMFDDIIIFGCAAFAINKYVGAKYEKYSTIIGGGLIFIIGIFIVFFPNLLK
jgi:glutaredoxin